MPVTEMTSRFLRRIMRSGALPSKAAATVDSQLLATSDYDPWPWLRSAYSFGTLLDIGANKGDYGAFIANYLNVERAYFFEPQAACFSQIREFTKGLPHAEILQMVLSEESGTVSFHEANQNPSSSMLPLNRAHTAAFPEIRQTREFKVEAHRLDDVMASRDMPGDIIIKMDVQGVEDRVVRGGTTVFRKARTVVVEMSFVPLYQGQALFEEVHATLVDCGLRLAGIRNQIVSTRPLFAHFLYLRADQEIQRS